MHHPERLIFSWEIACMQRLSSVPRQWLLNNCWTKFCNKQTHWSGLCPDNAICVCSIHPILRVSQLFFFLATSFALAHRTTRFFSWKCFCPVISYFCYNHHHPSTLDLSLSPPSLCAQQLSHKGRNIVNFKSVRGGAVAICSWNHEEELKWSPLVREIASDWMLQTRQFSIPEVTWWLKSSPIMAVLTRLFNTPLGHFLPCRNKVLGFGKSESHL